MKRMIILFVVSALLALLTLMGVSGLSMALAASSFLKNPGESGTQSFSVQDWHLSTLSSFAAHHHDAVIYARDTPSRSLNDVQREVLGYWSALRSLPEKQALVSGFYSTGPARRAGA